MQLLINKTKMSSPPPQHQLFFFLFFLLPKTLFNNKEPSSVKVVFPFYFQKHGRFSVETWQTTFVTFRSKEDIVP